MSESALSIEVDEKIGSVDAIWMRPRGATAAYTLAHGAGANMHHRFMDAMAQRLATRKIATLRYQFPYMQHGKGRPDPQPRLLATVRAAIEATAKKARGLPVIAGGKSMGGRMTSLLAAKDPPAGLRGLAYLGFPLHAPGKDGVQRAAHLPAIAIPMLFVQGTRDKLANLELMQEVVTGLSTAHMHVVDGGDHSFAVPKRTGRTADEVLDEVADVVAEWTRDNVT